MDLSIITAIIAVAAIISPILVALINNHHSYRMRQLDIKRKIGQQQFDTCHTEKVF
ncbi:hypothetical protein [Emergencia sp.]|uniref:hypothetical protein n=1 Tax=Emergencia sp. TaxID=1926557 RepID=UPI003AF09B49